MLKIWQSCCLVFYWTENHHFYLGSFLPDQKISRNELVFFYFWLEEFAAYHSFTNNTNLVFALNWTLTFFDKSNIKTVFAHSSFLAFKNSFNPSFQFFDLYWVFNYPLKKILDLKFPFILLILSQLKEDKYLSSLKWGRISKPEENSYSTYYSWYCSFLTSDCSEESLLYRQLFWGIFLLERSECKKYPKKVEICWDKVKFTIKIV